MSRFPLLLLFLAILLAGPARAQFGMEESFGLAGKKSADSSVATLVSENTAIAPGVPFTVAIKLDLPEGWHSYYVNSGGLELPLRIDWSLPEGFTAGSIQWPTPEVIESYDSKSFAYSGSPVFLIDITPPATVEPGSKASIKAEAKWQICRTGACMDESESFSFSLPIAAAAELDPSQTDLFRAARKTIPQSAESWIATFEKSGDSLQLKVRPGPGSNLTDDPKWEFIPSVPFAKSLNDGGTITRDGSDWIFTLKTNESDILGNPIEMGEALTGILTSDIPLDASGTRALLIEASRTGDQATSPTVANLSGIKMLGLLGSMFLGGLILNLMPCVFPVIGLKIMGFVQQAGEDSRKIVRHGLSFTAGVMISFWIISGILFAARAALLAKTGSAESIGWGYQLQNPWVVLGILILIFLLALNMFGVFEIGTSATSIGGSLQAKQGTAGAFFSGILATIVATPCSAPFLGAAIGLAIGLPAAQFFGAFSAMAIGLAAPYLLLSIFPKLVEYLPRPGAWMESFKQAMSFLLFATAGYLLYVYVRQIALENMLGPILGLSAIAVAAWIYGRWNLPHRAPRTRFTAIALAVVFAFAGFWVAKPPVKSALVWEPWSAARVEELNKTGVPVYVDFTATWCLTCQFNKKLAYPPEVIALMHEKGVVALRADKTNPDPAIDKALRELKRTAIPVNVLYVPGKEPIITPEILSADYMKSLIGGIEN